MGSSSRIALGSDASVIAELQRALLGVGHLASQRLRLGLQAHLLAAASPWPRAMPAMRSMTRQKLYCRS